MKRLTVDISQKEHKYLKMASAKLGVSMKEFVLSATLKKMEELEDEWLVKQAEETLRRIKSGEEKTFPLRSKRKSKRKKGI